MTPTDTQTPATHDRKHKREPARHTCGGCTTQWTSLRIAHCGNCHNTFAGITWFDLHRDQTGDHGTCLNPNSILTATGQPRMHQDPHGTWRGPGMTPEALAILRANT